MKKLILAALVGLLPMAALADTTISGPITFKSPSMAVNGSNVSVPTATTSVFGLVKPDGTTITISSGVIHAAGGSPASPVNAIQKNAAGAFGAAALSDDGTTITATEPTVINVPGTLGSELLSNPAFVANDTGWTLGSDTVWSSGLFTTTCSCSDASVSATFASVAGNYYKVHVDFTITGDQNYIYFDNNSSQSSPVNGPNQDFYFTADYTGVDTIFADFWNYNPGAVRQITGVSVTQVTPINGVVPLAIFPLAPYDPHTAGGLWSNQGVIMQSGFVSPWLTGSSIPNCPIIGGSGANFTCPGIGGNLLFSAGTLDTSQTPTFNTVTINGGQLFVATSSGTGGVDLNGPDGQRFLLGADGLGTSFDGQVYITSGFKTPNGAPVRIITSAGVATGGNGGELDIQAGPAFDNTANGGDLNLSAGLGVAGGAGRNGNVTINADTTAATGGAITLQGKSLIVFAAPDTPGGNRMLCIDRSTGQVYTGTTTTC